MSTEEKIQQQLEENPVMLYMKGTPESPQCGFSAKASGLLASTGIGFAYCNVLESPFIYEKLPAVSNFPTYPQLFIKGELIGGSDIVEEMLASGDLLPMLQDATATMV
jgi:monothiol glutaredoxin